MKKSDKLIVLVLMSSLNAHNICYAFLPTDNGVDANKKFAEAFKTQSTLYIEGRIDGSTAVKNLVYSMITSSNSSIFGNAIPGISEFGDPSEYGKIGSNIGESIVGTGITEITRGDPTGISGTVAGGILGGSENGGILGAGGAAGGLGGISGGTLGEGSAGTGGNFGGIGGIAAGLGAFGGGMTPISPNAGYSVQDAGPGGVDVRVNISPKNPLKHDKVEYTITAIPKRGNVVVPTPVIQESEVYDTEGKKEKEFIIPYMVLHPDEPPEYGVIRVKTQVDVAEMSNLRSSGGKDETGYGENVLQNGGAAASGIPTSVITPGASMSTPQLPSIQSGSAAGIPGTAGVGSSVGGATGISLNKETERNLLGELINGNSLGAVNGDGIFGGLSSKLFGSSSNGMPQINISIPDTGSSILDRLSSILHSTNRYEASNGSSSPGTSDANGETNKPSAKTVVEVKEKIMKRNVESAKVAIQILRSEGKNPEEVFKKLQKENDGDVWTNENIAWDFNPVWKYTGGTQK